MKRLISVLYLIFIFSYSGFSSRIITNFDIARWFLDSDLVLICNANAINSILINKYDTLLSNQIHEKWDVIREEYTISVDSLIKTKISSVEIPKTILTPEFLINYSKTQTVGEEFSGFDSSGDSTFVIEVRYINDDQYFDNSYFKLGPKEKYFVILTKTNLGYVIDYATICNQNILDLIMDIKEKGESYFQTSK